jgi:hypothetical protein
VRSATEQPREESAAASAGGLLGGGVLAVAPAVRGNGGPDLRDVLAAAGPRGPAAGPASGRTAHGGAPSFRDGGRGEQCSTDSLAGDGDIDGLDVEKMEKLFLSLA